MIIPTSIKVNGVSGGGSYYPESVVKEAIDDFNNNLKVRKSEGGLINRKHIQITDEVTHITKKLFIEDGRLYADIELLDNRHADDIRSKIKGGYSVIARPVMAVPSYVLDDPSKIISDITKIMKVQLEIQ